jgi:hypothetical protein
MVPPSASRWRVCGLLLRERGAAGNSIRRREKFGGATTGRCARLPVRGRRSGRWCYSGPTGERPNKTK